MRQWAARRVTSSAGVPGLREDFCGETSDGLLSLLADSLRPGRTLRIMVADGRQFLTLTDWFSLRTSLGLRDKVVSLEFPPFIYRGESPQGAVEITELSNWGRISLDDVAEWVGVHLPADSGEGMDDADYTRRARAEAAVIAEFQARLVGWLIRHDAGMPAYTVASQAMRWWRRTWRGYRPRQTEDADVLALERSAYYGGRCELGYRGCVSLDGRSPLRVRHSTARELAMLSGTRAHYCDYRSAYPAAMLDLAAPVRLIASFDRVTMPHLELLMRDHHVIARVRVRSVERAYPHRVGAASRFVCGNFVTTLSHPELQYALENGDVEAIYQVSTYETKPLFRDWVAELFGLRRRAKLERDNFVDGMLKLLLNSLHGKFGVRPEGWTDDPETPPLRVCAPGGPPPPPGLPGIAGPDGLLRWGCWRSVDCQSGVIRRHRVLDGRVQTWGPRPLPSYAHPAIAAAIASACRVRLSRLLDSLGPGRWLYCDTDSVHVTDEGLAVLRDRGLLGVDRLGCLRLVESADSAIYLQKRVYRFGDRWVVAGKPEDVREMQDLVYLSARAESVDDLITRGFTGGLTVRETKCEISLDYSGGAVGPEGWVRPWLICE